MKGRITTALCMSVYRMYFTVRDAPPDRSRVRRRYRAWVRHTIHRLLRRYVLPEIRLMVRVQSGLSRGLWIHARFPEEIAYWRGTREAATAEEILGSVGKGAVVYDVGAHIGTVTFGTARLVGETGRVIAFEADPENVDRLHEATKQNGLESRVRVVHAAVWSTARPGISFRRGSTRLSHGGVDEGVHAPVCADGPSIKVPAITLDHFITAGEPRPDLVKIDVEGGEFEVLRGGEALFSSSRPRVIVEVHHVQAFHQISSWMTEHRYQGNWTIPEPGFPRMLVAWPVETVHER